MLAELHDVWISGNDGVVTDSDCGLYLPSHGVEIPLHLNLPHETPPERRHDASIREADVVLSLVQLFAANFYSFVADALARLAMAMHALDEPTRRALRVALPADGARLKPWMWALLERLHIDKAASFPYPIRAYADRASLSRAAAARVHASTLSYSTGSGKTHDTCAGTDAAATSPPAPAYATRLPGRATRRGSGWLPRHMAGLAASSAYTASRGAHPQSLERASAAGRMGAALREHDGHELRLLSDARPLADAARCLQPQLAVIGVHGAGWANLSLSARARMPSRWHCPAARYLHGPRRLCPRPPLPRAVPFAASRSLSLLSHRATLTLTLTLT